MNGNSDINRSNRGLSILDRVIHTIENYNDYVMMVLCAEFCFLTCLSYSDAEYKRLVDASTNHQSSAADRDNLRIYQILNESFLLLALGVALNFCALKQVLIRVFYLSKSSHIEQLLSIIEKGNMIQLDLKGTKPQRSGSIGLIAQVMQSYLQDIAVLVIGSWLFGCSLYLSFQESFVSALAVSILLKEC